MGKLSKALEKSEQQETGGAAKVEPLPRHSRQSGSKKEAYAKKPSAGDLSAKDARQRWDRRLQISTDPQNGYFESFRRLRASIVYPSSGRPPRTLLVTSLVPNEGKGFVCANLGVALARGMEQHAMMVDCDFRNPTLAGLFGFSNETGLSDYLTDQAGLSLLIRKTGQQKLSLLPSGHAPGNPSELLASAAMASLIKEVADRYSDRIVLFDSPPEVVASETSILAKHIDGVILVIRHGYSKKEDVKKFVTNLGREKIYGVVFNAYPENSVEAFMEKRLGSGYGYGYYNYSSY